MDQHAADHALDAFDAALLDRIGGTRLEVGGHRPFRLNDTDAVWLVLHGQVDLFAVEFEAGEPVSQRRHVATFHSGEVLFGTGSQPFADRPARSVELLAVATMGTALFRGSRARIAGGEFDLIVVSWIDRWLSTMGEAIGGLSPVPHQAQLVEAEPDVPVADGVWLTAQYQDVVWIEPVAGALAFQHETDMRLQPGGPLLPITDRMTAQMIGEGRVSAWYTPTALFQRRLWPGLDLFHATVLRCAAAMETREREADRVAIQRRQANRLERLDTALGGLAGILGHRPDMPVSPVIDRHRELYAAARLTADALGIAIDPPAATTGEARADPLPALLRRAGLMSRRIVLRDGWWTTDSGPVIGSMADDGRPVALIPRGPGSYLCHDPRNGSVRPVDRTVAESLSGEGRMVYRPFPERTAGAMALLRFGAFGLTRDLRAIAALGVLAGLLSLAVPIATGHLLVDVLPFARMEAVGFLLAALVAAAIGTATFGIARAIGLLRVEGRMDLSIQAAVWDRLLALPPRFFRRYTAGDLADRANGISAIRQIMTASVAAAAMGMMSASFSFLLLFWYSWRLSLIACGLMVVLAGATALFGWMQMPHQRALFRMQGRLDGLVFQLLSGIAKLRVANSEALGLARWAEGFAEQKRHTLSVRAWAAAQQTFNAAFPVLASLGLFAFIYYGLYRAGYQTGFDLAAFLSFNAAFGQFMMATVTLTGSITTMLAVIPLYERVAPILAEPREAASTKVDPGELRGDIELRRVGFRYKDDGPLVLDDISFRISPGEYVAIVGPSGSGKSTIYRLLLGFEQPGSGSVMLDGHELDSLDLGAVRGQMGVVLQNGRLLAGSIFENIVGSLPLTQEDAWEAARRAGFEKDIRDMPMGMHTVVPESGIGLSGGQRQRLLIARALVRRPRIVLFDEATSALDNQTQAMVQESLERLKVTRVVIAHRLSTIRGVDRIYVVQDGRIVEEGSYQALLDRGGTFAHLARRQML